MRDDVREQKSTKGVGNGVNFLSDAPIQSVAEDRYERTAIAAKIASAIRNITSDESFVVGLSGEWGSGKTSLVNMACDYLESPTDGTAAVSVVKFNPWLIETKEALLGSFFDALASALPRRDGKHGSKWRDN